MYINRNDEMNTETSNIEEKDYKPQVKLLAEPLDDWIHQQEEI